VLEVPLVIEFTERFAPLYVCKFKKLMASLYRMIQICLYNVLRYLSEYITWTYVNELLL